MKKDLFNFSDFDDNIVNSIADNYPDMNKSQQKAICRKTRKRLNFSDDSAVGDVVSGIEPARKRSPWYICGTAAAAVFAVALIPTAFKALKNAPDGPENIQEPPVAVDMATAPVEDEEKSMAAVTTKIGKSDIIAEVTAPQPPTDETTTVLPTSPENPEKTKETEAPPSPPVTEGKRTTTKTLRTTVPQAPPAPTSAPAVSTPVTTTKPVIVPPAPPAISEGDIFDMLANLSYRQETCDGIPDYTLQTDDGTTYQILTGCKHVWRNGREEADITPEILEWVKKYGEPYKVKAHSATAEIDWSMGDFNEYVWGLTYSGYSEVITNTDELREYLAKVYRNDKVEEYLNQYNDSYFKSNVLALNTIYQGAGTENKLKITGLNVSDREIKVTGKWNMGEVEAAVMSICLVKVEIPNYLYVEQSINWNISNNYDNYYTILMTEIEDYERLNNCYCERDRKILDGEISPDAPRITIEQAKKIINEHGSPENAYDYDYAYRIISAFDEVCECPDVIGGSGITRYEYWLNDSGDEKIVVFLEETSVWYHSKFGAQKLI